MSLIPAYPSTLCNWSEVSNVDWGFPNSFMMPVYIGGDNIYNIRYLVHQGSPEVISVVGTKNSYDATSPSNHSSLKATWQPKVWDANISGDGAWVDYGPAISLDVNGDTLSQVSEGHSQIYRPISGKYGDPYDNFYPFCAGKLVVPTGASGLTNGQQTKFEGTFDMTENLKLTSSKNSDVQLIAIDSYTGVNGFAYDLIYFDGNVSCISGAGDTPFLHDIVDRERNIRTVARFLFADENKFNILKNILKSADGSNLVGFPATWAAYLSARNSKSMLGVTYRNKIGPGYPQSRWTYSNNGYWSYATSYGFVPSIINGEFQETPVSEVTSDTLSDWRAIPFNAPQEISEIRIGEGNELLPVIHGIGGPPVSGAALLLEDTTYSVETSGAVISFPSQALNQSSFIDSVKNNSSDPIVRINYFSCDCEVLGEATTNSTYWGGNMYAVRLKHILPNNTPPIPVIENIKLSPKKWTFALNHRTGAVQRIWESKIGKIDYVPSPDYFPFSCCLRDSSPVGMPLASITNPPTDTEYEVSHCQFQVYTHESSIASGLPLSRPTKPTLRDLGWQVGDRISLMTCGAIHRTADEILPAFVTPKTLFYAGSSNFSKFIHDLPIDRVYFRFFYQNSDTAGFKIEKVDDAQGTGVYDPYSTTSLFTSTFSASTTDWQFVDLPTPISAKQTLIVSCTANSNLQGVYLMSRKTGFFQHVRHIDGDRVYGGRIHNANTHINT